MKTSSSRYVKEWGLKGASYCAAGSLIGTHAHEVMSVVGQLMSCWDRRVKSSGGGPVAVSALVAHLLFLAVNGGLQFATALADTFGTEAFIAAALVARVPQEFVEDVGSSDSSASIPQGQLVIEQALLCAVLQGAFACSLILS